jgi:hypothetical protein
MGHKHNEKIFSVNAKIQTQKSGITDIHINQLCQAAVKTKYSFDQLPLCSVHQHLVIFIKSFLYSLRFSINNRYSTTQLANYSPSTYQRTHSPTHQTFFCSVLIKVFKKFYSTFLNIFAFTLNILEDLSKLLFWL